MNAARKITDEITMRDIFSKYGFQPNRRGNICCPFHNEKNPSLGTYADGRRWKCFGCGEGGSVIDFVMKLFDVDFRQAIVKINYDFGLALPLGQKLNRREREIMKRKEAERQQIVEEQRKKATERESEYQAIWNAWVSNDNTARAFKGMSRCAFDYPDEYWKAILYRKTADYLLDCTER